MITCKDAGIRLIKETETLRLRAYKPTPQDRWTIGYGTTTYPDGKMVKEGDVCTLMEAEMYFAKHIQKVCGQMDYLLGDTPLTQSMQDALVSLCYNCGVGAVHYGTTIGDNLRSKKYFAAWQGFALWHKQAGRNLRGLAIRRAKEMQLFMSEPATFL